MASKRQLTAQEASELMTSNPQRTDVYLDYKGTARQLTSIEWSVDQMWDVWASGMRFSFLKNADNFFQMVEDTPSPEPTQETEQPMASSKLKLTAAQERELKLIATHQIDRGGVIINPYHKDKTTLKLWAKLVELGLIAAEYLNVRETRYTLTDAGREKVAPLFADASLFASEPAAQEAMEAVAGEPVSDEAIPFASFDDDVPVTSTDSTSAGDTEHEGKQMASKTTPRQQLMSKVSQRIAYKLASGIDVTPLMLNEMIEGDAARLNVMEYYLAMTDNQYSRFVSEAMRWAKHYPIRDIIKAGTKLFIRTDLVNPQTGKTLRAGSVGTMIRESLDSGIMWKVDFKSHGLVDILFREGEFEFLPADEPNYEPIEIEADTIVMDAKINPNQSLSKPQKEALALLHDAGENGLFRIEIHLNTLRVLQREGYAVLEKREGVEHHKIFLTESGQQLARDLFGSGEPPSPAPTSRTTNSGFTVPLKPSHIDRLGDAVTQTGNTIRFHRGSDLMKDGMEWSWMFAGTGRNPNGHGRHARRHNLQNKPQKRAKSANKVYPSMNIERNTVEAKKWRQKRHLANSVAMPTPTITIAELLQQGLRVVEKPRKQLTRVLEGRRAA